MEALLAFSAMITQYRKAFHADASININGLEVEQVIEHTSNIEHRTTNTFFEFAYEKNKNKKRFA